MSIRRFQAMHWSFSLIILTELQAWGPPSGPSIHLIFIFGYYTEFAAADPHLVNGQSLGLTLMVLFIFVLYSEYA